MKFKHFIIIGMLFFSINLTIYYVSKINAENTISIVLKDKINSLSTHYKILLESQRNIALCIYHLTTKSTKFIEIMKEANTASPQRRDILRAKLHDLLKERYKILRDTGILQYHFVFPDNRVFYRAHKPSQFGDDLTGIRTDFEYTNRTKKPIRGFTQGRTAHGFRNIFPLFDRENHPIGAMEISFSSDSFQWYLNHISGIHSHFLVDKKIFDAKAWQRDDLILKYIQSAEHQDYMLTLGDMHTKKRCVIDNGKKLAPKRAEIDAQIKLKKPFGFYVEHYEERYHIDTVSFLPIKNIEHQVVAWIVSYEEGDIIHKTLKNTQWVRVTSFLLSLLFLYFLFRELTAREKLKKKNSYIKEQQELLSEILNTTDTPMFLTDFKEVKLANEKFKKLLNKESVAEINQDNHTNILQIFEAKEGYLHQGLLRKDEAFISLIERTPKEERMVMIVDKNLISLDFSISVLKTKARHEYLITLSDITMMKKLQTEIVNRASIDGLTQVYNRNKFDEIVTTEIQNSQNDARPLSMAILDIDNFKIFNDTYGHLIGDEVLIQLAQTVDRSMREEDTFARWGGEEFVILFKDTSLTHAQSIAEKLKEKIQANQHPKAGQITASFGLCQYKRGETLETLFKRCDDALYCAKKSGRNRVEIGL